MTFCLLGVCGGLLQARLLAGFVGAVTSGRLDTPAVMRGVLQGFLPLALLLPVALWQPSRLLWTGGSMAAALLLSTGICLLRRRGELPHA